MIIIIISTWKYWKQTIKEVEMKEKIRKEYLRQMSKLLKTKLCSRNLIRGINTWAVPLVRYLGPFLKRTREGLRQIDQRTRKLMIMHKALYPRDDIDWIFVPRKEGGVVNIKDCVDASIQGHEDYTEMSKITGANNSDVIIKQTERQQELGNRNGKKNKCVCSFTSDNLTRLKMGRPRHGYEKKNLVKETESLLIAAQNNAIRTNYIKAKIDNRQKNNKCKLWADKDGMFNHIVSESSKLTQKEYKSRHDWVGSWSTRNCARD